MRTASQGIIRVPILALIAKLALQDLITADPEKPHPMGFLGLSFGHWNIIYIIRLAAAYTTMSILLYKGSSAWQLGDRFKIAGYIHKSDWFWPLVNDNQVVAAFTEAENV